MDNKEMDNFFNVLMEYIAFIIVIHNNSQKIDINSQKIERLIALSDRKTDEKEDE